MAEARKRHIYFDQQKPAEEPEDPAHSQVRQEFFARQPPSNEDQYFLEQERKAAHQESTRKETPHPEATSRVEVPRERPKKLFQRIAGIFRRR